MATCGTMSANIAAACDTKVVAGADNFVAVFNFEDWQKATITKNANFLLVESIVFPTGVTGFKIEGTSPNIVRPNYALTREAGQVRYKHAISVMVENASSSAKQQIYKLQQGRVVLIVFTNNKEIIIYGAGTGLLISAEAVRDLYANQGAFMLPFATDDETLEALPPLDYVGTGTYNFQTAKAEILALLAA